MRILLLAIPLVLASCTAFNSTDEQAIRAVMADQEAAWDRGDISGFMSGYCKEVCFIGRAGRTCGKDSVTANYLRSYPNKDAMGDLTFTIHEVLSAGTDHAWVTGLWDVERTNDTLDGGFSLLWTREKEGWRILRDHSY